MSRLQKILSGIVVLCVVFFGFVVFRIAAAPHDDSVKLAKIPTDNNQQLGTKAYKDAYPLEYNSFMKNNEQAPSPTGYGGSQGNHSRLAEEPEMLENWKGYKFELQYDDDRGHTYAGEDILNTKRRPGQKGSCIVCKSSYMYDVYFKESGWDFASKPFDDMAAPISEQDAWFGCSTCHDPETMELRVYNQAFVEAMARRGIDISKASHNEMRGYVCGQCHTEYYFAKADGRVVLPWDKGLDPTEEYAYYQTIPGGFDKDWTHKDSKTPMLKAQHPDYEIWQSSVHAQNGVTCVDCHMPYMRENGQKYTSHWQTSPLRTTQESCLKCHDESADGLLQRVKTIQDNTFRLERIAGQTVAKANLTVKAAMDAGATDEQLGAARAKLREAQWYWDWVEASNSMGFHNPDLCLRTLGLSIDLAHQAIESANGSVKGAL